MKTSVTAALGLAFTLLGTGSSQAADLIAPKVVLSKPYVSQTTDVTLSFETVTGLSEGNKLIHVHTEGLILTDGNCNSDVTIKLDGTVTPINAFESCLLFATRGIEVDLGFGQTVPAGTRVEMTIGQNLARTKAAAGVYVMNSFRTSTSSGVPIDSANPPPSMTLSEAPGIPTLAQWAMIGLTLALAGLGALVGLRRRQAA